LIAAWDRAPASAWAYRFRDLRVYLRPDRACTDQAAALVRSVFTGTTCIEFLPARLCRDELLIEVEGTVASARDATGDSTQRGAP